MENHYSPWQRHSSSENQWNRLSKHVPLLLADPIFRHSNEDDLPPQLSAVDTKLTDILNHRRAQLRPLRLTPMWGREAHHNPIPFSLKRGRVQSEQKVRSHQNLNFQRPPLTPPCLCRFLEPNQIKEKSLRSRRAQHASTYVVTGGWEKARAATYTVAPCHPVLPEYTAFNLWFCASID